LYPTIIVYFAISTSSWWSNWSSWILLGCDMATSFNKQWEYPAIRGADSAWSQDTFSHSSLLQYFWRRAKASNYSAGQRSEVLL